MSQTIPLNDGMLKPTSVYALTLRDIKSIFYFFFALPQSKSLMHETALRVYSNMTPSNPVPATHSRTVQISLESFNDGHRWEESFLQLDFD